MIAIGIAHAEWAPGRAESLKRLLAQLEGDQDHFVMVHRSAKREHASVWAIRLWRWAAIQDVEAVVLLNDDVILCPGFVANVHSAVATSLLIYGMPLSLHVQGAEAAKHASGLCNKLLPVYSYTGPGVVLSPNHARLLANFAETHPDIWTTQNEDGMANVWAWDRQVPFLATVPALVKHDVSVRSTLGYDWHALRESSVQDWASLADKPYELGPMIPNPWMSVETMEALRKMTIDPKDAGKARIVIATPTRGAPAPEYTTTIMKLVAASEGTDRPWKITQMFSRNDSIVYARSTAVRDFLAGTGTHLFFVDDDQSFEACVLDGMLASGHGFVAAPYPRRDCISFSSVAKAAKSNDATPEAYAYRYSVRTIGGELRPCDEHDCAPIAGIGLGCVLLSREVLQQMTEQYRHELLFVADDDRETVALFQLMLVDNKARGNVELLGEDMSFCHRWRAMGGEVRMYLGPGSPISHHGPHEFKGSLEAFGYRRTVP